MRRLMNLIVCSATLASGMVAGAQPNPKPPVILSDFSICTPSSALTTEPEWDRWQVIEYEAAGVSGKMIGAKSMIEPPHVTLPLGVTGWHKIYVGYWNPYFEYDGEMVLRLKLTGDPCFDRIMEEKPKVGEAEQVHPGKTSIIERFWRAEDLTDKGLAIGKFKGAKAYIAYVKLVPMSPEEVAEVKEKRDRKRDRRLVGSIDGTGFPKYYHSIPTEEDLREWVEVYRDSDVGKIVWAVSYGDWVNYPSKFGTLWTEIKTYGKMRDNVYLHWIHPILRGLKAKGIVTQDVIARHLHSMGMKFDIMIRPSIQRNPLESMQGFFEKHPELRIRHADGRPVEKLSFAYPEVRDFTLSIIREASERFDVDGVNICFVRLNLCMGWEKPVLDAFRAKGYNDKLHNVGKNDSRLRKIRSEFLLQFMRDARKVLDEVGKKKGKRLELSAWVWPWAGHRGYSPGFDVDYRTMMKEKLLDSVIIHQGSGVDEEDLAIARANGCKYIIAPDGGGPGVAKALIDGYAKGIDGAAEWDINYPCFKGQAGYEKRWKYLKVAGSPEELKKVLASPPPPPEKKFVTIHKINGKSVSGTDLWQACYAGG